MSGSSPLVRSAWALPLALALAARAQEPPPAPPPAPDPLAYVAAPGKVVLAGQPRVGWRVTQLSRAGEQLLETRWAIVGQTAEAWQLEHTSPVLAAASAGRKELEGALMGLLVRKRDGAVTAARVGRPGEPGKTIRVSEVDQGQPEDAPQESQEQLVVAGGTFRARKESHPQRGSTWTGLEGPAREVVLKVEGAQAYELARAPEQVEVAGRQVLRFSYTNSTALDLVEDPIVAAFFPAGGPGRGLWAMRGQGFEIAVSEVGTDARPALKWD